MSVKGTVFAIVCPALEDELVFALENDSEPKNIFVIDNEDTSTILPKLDRRSIKYEIMDEFQIRTKPEVNPEQFNIIILMNPMRLHKEPTELRKYIENQLMEYKGKFDVIALYYAMCGNFGWDVAKWAKETLNIPVTEFYDLDGNVVDDCIGVAVGGKEQYRDLVHKYTGMLFLTPAVANNWDEHLVFEDEKEWNKFYETRDDYMRDLFSWGHYEYALKIDTGLGDREHYGPKCEEVGRRMNLKVIDPSEPVATTKLASDIYERTKACLKQC